MTEATIILWEGQDLQRLWADLRVVHRRAKAQGTSLEQAALSLPKRALVYQLATALQAAEKKAKGDG